MNRVWRKLVGGLGILALVFAQLAVSAYACPMLASAGEAAPESSAPSPCDQSDRDQANLCEKHCHDSELSPAHVVAVPGAFVPGYIALVHLPVSPASSASAEDPALLHATSPPATIRNCCFRI